MTCSPNNVAKGSPLFTSQAKSAASIQHILPSLNLAVHLHWPAYDLKQFRHLSTGRVLGKQSTTKSQGIHAQVGPVISLKRAQRRLLVCHDRCRLIYTQTHVVFLNVSTHLDLFDWYCMIAWIMPLISQAKVAWTSEGCTFLNLIYMVETSTTGWTLIQS